MYQSWVPVVYIELWLVEYPSKGVRRVCNRTLTTLYHAVAKSDLSSIRSNFLLFPYTVQDDSVHGCILYAFQGIEVGGHTARTLRQLA